MEVLYADPKRTTVKKTQEFFRLERITISHADPKFLKLLELGGAQVIIDNVTQTKQDCVVLWKDPNLQISSEIISLIL